PGNLLDGERHGPRRNIDDDIDLAGIVPLARDARAHIRLVLMIGTDHLDRLTLHFAVEIRSRHLGGNERARTGGVGVEAAHIREHPDLDNIIGNLGACRGRTNYCRSEAKHGELLSHLHSQWPTLHIAEMAGPTVGFFFRKGPGAMRTLTLRP